MGLMLFELTIILIIGLIITVCANRLNIPSPFLLVGSGLVLGFLNLYMDYAFILPLNTLKPLAIIALVATVFSVYSKFNYHSFDHHTKQSLRHSFFFLVLVIVGLGFAYFIIFGSILGALIIPFLVAPVSLRDLFSRDKHQRSHAASLLQNEEKLTSAVVCVIPFLIAALFPLMGLEGKAFELFLYPALGISVGLVTALIFFKFINFPRVMPVLVFAGSVFSYLFAKAFGGSGVLSVAAFAFLFSNIQIKNKQKVRRFAEQLSDTLSVVALIVLGITLFSNLTQEMVLVSLGMFILLLLIRFLSVVFTDLNLKEKMFMALNCSHGKLAGVVALAIITMAEAELFLQVQTAILVIFFSGFSTLSSRLFHKEGGRKCS